MNLVSIQKSELTTTVEEDYGENVANLRDDYDDEKQRRQAKLLSLCNHHWRSKDKNKNKQTRK